MTEGSNTPRIRFAVAVLIVFLTVSAPVGAADADPAAAAPADAEAPAGGSIESRFQARKVVAFGDVHGAYSALTSLLRQTGMVDAELTWSGGDAHLVSLGDLLDRGPDSRAVLDLLQRLQGEAGAAGGRVHVLLGNHELMNLTDDLRYVSAQERAGFADLAAEPGADGLAGVRAAFARDGRYGAWLLRQPVTITINDTAFVHGGLTPLVADLGPAGVNDAVHQRLTELLRLRDQLATQGVVDPDLEVHDAADAVQANLDALPEAVRQSARQFIERVADPLFADDGPFWYRGNAQCHPLLEQPPLRRVLDAWGVQRVVVGHTPTPDHRVHVRLDGAVLLADTGMLASHYGGRASALVIEDGALAVRYADQQALAEPLTETGTPLEPLYESAVTDALAAWQPARDDRDAWRELTVGNGDPGAAGGSAAGAAATVAARFSRRSSSEAAAELAALRLDRLLGLDLVMPVASVDGGIAVAAWPGVVDEAQRQQTGGGPPSCVGGSVFDLLYAFDALIGNEGRSAGTMIYDPRTWRVGSVGHGRSFGRGARFPAYLERVPGRLPVALAERLKSLDQATLESALGQYINAARIRAVLARRDELLARWTVEG